MTEFITRVVRDEWVVQLFEVDQYGVHIRTPYWTSQPFPTYDAAYAYLPRVAVRHEHIRERWIPRKAKHSYTEASVTFRRKEITNSVESHISTSPRYSLEVSLLLDSEVQQ